MKKTNKITDFKGISIIALSATAIVIVLYFLFFRNKKTKYEVEGETSVISYIPKGLNVDAQSKAIAEAIYKAVKGIGTDEKAIYDAFQSSYISSDDNLNRVILAFGSRDGMDMQQWLRDDLNASDMRKVNQILADRGINLKL